VSITSPPREDSERRGETRNIPETGVMLKAPQEEEPVSFYKAEYIWMDGAQPTQKLRSKTKIVHKGEEPPIWGFDGSSTNQATGHNSDCVLKPVFVCPDPVRGGDDKLVMCEVLLTDMTPHPTNTRARLREVAAKHAAHEVWFGIEQEYTFFDGIKPLGWPNN